METIFRPSILCLMVLLDTSGFLYIDNNKLAQLSRERERERERERDFIQLTDFIRSLEYCSVMTLLCSSSCRCLMMSSAMPLSTAL